MGTPLQFGKIDVIQIFFEDLRNKAGPIDKQRLNSALAHLRKVGTQSALDTSALL